MKLSIKDANKVLQNYSLGKVISVKKLTSGYANINYKIKTTKGNFLLRICAEKPLEEILHEMKVMKVLKKMRFPTAFPIQRKDGTYINNTKLGNIVLYEFAEGKEPKVNELTAREIAKAVATLNSFKNWNSLAKENAVSIKSCKDLIRKFDSAKNKYPQIFEYFKEETKFLAKPLMEKVPKGLIHADIFPDNTKFIGNKLSAILDFEEVCTDNLLIDVGVTINGFCFQNNRLNPKLLNIFLNEYEKVRKLSYKEKELLPYYIQWGAHSMIYFHLKYLINKKDSRKLKRARYLMNRVKLLRKESILIQKSLYKHLLLNLT